MSRNWLLLAPLVAILAVLFDFLGHIVVFQQGISEPLPPTIYWVAKFFVVFFVFLLGGFFLRGVRGGLILTVIAALGFGVIWEFSPVGIDYTYGIVIHLFHIPAILLGWVFATLLGRIFHTRALLLIFVLILIATTVAIGVLSLLQGVVTPAGY